MQDISLKEPSPRNIVSSTLNAQRILTFILTAFLYSTLHASRTAWAYVKPSFASEHQLSDTTLSLFDTSFLIAYALGLYLSGWLGDRIKLKSLLGRGMIATVIALSILTYFMGYLKISSTTIAIVAFVINGLGQSTGFPGCIAILTNWFSSKEKGLIFGAWLININFGNILGQQIGKLCVDTLKVEWFYALVVSASALLIATLLMLHFLVAHPSECKSRFNGFFFSSNSERNLDQESVSMLQNQDSTSSAKDFVPGQRGIGFWEAWKAPGVFLYSIVFICVKSALYGLLFWLPMYLRTDVGFKEETAGLLASLEIGQLLGVMILGYISDKLNNRAWIITISLLLVVATFFGIGQLHSKEQEFLFYGLLFVAGIFIGGPAGMIVSTVSSELGEEKSKGSKNRKVKSTSTITGIIDGSGTVGAAVTQLIFPYFRHNCFIFFTIVCLVAAILTPFAHRQITKANRPVKEVEEVEIASKTTLATL